jgi:hypothetical protein
MENILYTENQPTEAAPKRPQFLTVLCILTWIGSGLAFISGIYTFFTVDASAAMIESMNMGGADPTGMMSGVHEAMRLAVENKVPNLLVATICSLLCVFGAMQMWQLKKTGYFIYIAGEIVPPIAAFVLGGGGMLGSLGAAGALVIAIIWIVLYGLNLKHMK